MKSGLESKRRLLRPDRVELAAAFGEDTLRACLDCPRVVSVLIVSAQPVPVRPGVRHVEDPGTGLNDAIRAAVCLLPEGTPVAVLVADLPCLTSDALSDVLRKAQMVLEQASCATVPDSQETGTTMLLGRAPDVRPSFGPDSLRRHRDGGAVVLTAGLPARLDVDDETALAKAIDVGVGAATLRALGLRSRSPGK